MSRQKEQVRGELCRRDILDLYYCLFVKCQDLFNSALYSPLYERLSLQVTDDWAVTWTPCCIWSIFKLMNSLMKLFIGERMSVHLQFNVATSVNHSIKGGVSYQPKSLWHSHKIAAENYWTFPGCLAWGTSQILV